LDKHDVFASDINGNNTLPHEIEKYSSTTGELIAWVKIPELKTSEDTEIYIFYGNPDIGSSQERSSDVWNSNYKMVQHMNEDPSGTAPQIMDSTSNDNDGTASGSFSSSDLTNGYIGDAINFNGSDTKFDFDSNNPIGNAEDGFTLSAWISHDATDSGQHVVSFGNVQFRPTHCYVRDPSTWRYISYYSEDPNDDTWYYMVCNFDGEDLRAYMNATETNNSPANPAPIDDILDPYTFVVGYLQSSEYMDGRLDEIRISNVHRSSDWITTEYNNQNSTSTFYTVSDAVDL